ncbi:hypothetical protein [Spirosoma sp. KCTC 42546]|nr:hypothetical protein [Spirosoma sp. KCTC 42546]
MDIIYQPTFTHYGETDGILAFANANKVTEQVMAQKQVDELVLQRT